MMTSETKGRVSNQQESVNSNQRTVTGDIRQPIQIIKGESFLVNENFSPFKSPSSCLAFHTPQRQAANQPLARIQEERHHGNRDENGGGAEGAPLRGELTLQ